MVISLVIAIPVSILLTGFLVLYAVRLGLKWNVQLQKGEEPTIENPIQPIFEQREAQKTNAEMVEIIDEWLNGPKER